MRGACVLHVCSVLGACVMMTWLENMQRLNAGQGESLFCPQRLYVLMLGGQSRANQ